MRRRQLIAMLGVVLVAIAALGLPLALLSVRLVSDDARAELSREAEAVSGRVADQVLSGQLDASTLARVAPANRHVVVTTRSGTQLSAGHQVGAHPYTATVPLARGGTVEVQRSSSEVVSRELRAVLLVLAVSLLAAGIGVAVAVRLARRLSDPLLALAGRAGRLGAGDFRPDKQRYDIPELDGVADVLDTNGLRLAALVQRERDLVGDISHQLRSRLTAMSMRLEEIATLSGDPDSRREGQAALEQADRLSEVIDDLLAHHRAERLHDAVPVSIAAELVSLRAEWEPTLRAVDRRLETSGGEGVYALSTQGRLHQCLGVLVDNALRHGAGTVDVRVRETDQNVVIQVRDEGNGVPAELVPTLFSRGVSGDADGTGIGLGLARALIDGDGGRLELRVARPATFALYLRRTESGADTTPAPDSSSSTSFSSTASSPSARKTHRL